MSVKSVEFVENVMSVRIVKGVGNAKGISTSERSREKFYNLWGDITQTSI